MYYHTLVYTPCISQLQSGFAKETLLSRGFGTVDLLRK